MRDPRTRFEIAVLELRIVVLKYRDEVRRERTTVKGREHQRHEICRLDFYFRRAIGDVRKARDVMEDRAAPRDTKCRACGHHRSLHHDDGPANPVYCHLAVGGRDGILVFQCQCQRFIARRKDIALRKFRPPTKTPPPPMFAFDEIDDAEPDPADWWKAGDGPQQ